MNDWRNWSGLTTTSPREVIRPTDVAGVVAAVERARETGTTVKMPGTEHSFTGIAAPEGIMLEPSGLSGLVAVDKDELTVTARAGTPLHVLNAALTSHGLSL